MTMMEKLNRPALKEYAGAIAIVLGALPAITGMVISILSSYRGEPEAKKAYTALSAEVNKVHDWMEAMQLTMARYEGRQEGLSVAKQGEILAQIQALTAENAQLKKVATETHPAPAAAPVTTGSGFGAGAGRLGGSSAKKREPKASMGGTPDPVFDIANYEPPEEFSKQVPQKILPELEELPANLGDL
jgi:hypothetical protein